MNWALSPLCFSPALQQKLPIPFPAAHLAALQSILQIAARGHFWKHNPCPRRSPAAFGSASKALRMPWRLLLWLLSTPPTSPPPHIYFAEPLTILSPFQSLHFCSRPMLLPWAVIHFYHFSYWLTRSEPSKIKRRNFYSRRLFLMTLHLQSDLGALKPRSTPCILYSELSPYCV